MIRSRVIAGLTELAVSLGPITSGTQWHLFGSVNRDDPDASDIDLMILCKTDSQADMLRQAIDHDSLPLPLHLSLFTFEEAAMIDVTTTQQSVLVLELPPRLDSHGGRMR